MQLDDLASVVAAPDVESYRAAVLDVIGRVVGADSVGVNEVDLATGLLAAVWFSDPAVDVPHDAANAHIHDHPVMAFHRHFARGGALAISDLVSRRRWRESPLYREVLSDVVTEDQLSASFSPLPGIALAVAVNRSSFGFTDDDHVALDALLPFLAAGYSSALARSVWSATFHAPPVVPGEGDMGIVVLGPSDAVVDVSDVARDQLAAAGASVESVAAVVAGLRRRPGSTPRIRLGRHDFHVGATFAPDGREPTLIGLRHVDRIDAALGRLPLTVRQREVLRLAVEGATTRDIADRLGVAPGTVEKHFERIHAALGVRTRAQAVARVMRYDQR